MARVEVLGRDGLTRELLCRLFAASDDLAAPVVVLVEPSSSDWDAARERGARVVVMSTAPLSPDAVVFDVLSGADAVLDGDATPEDVHRAVRAVASGGTLLTPTQVRAIADRARAATSLPSSTVQLTEREHEVLSCIDAGMSVKETAFALGVACKTVENSRSRLFRKLGARNGSHALIAARELNVLMAAGTCREFTEANPHLSLGGHHP